ncbi:hypothetical protein, partial [Streptomyces sp. ISL-11]|uniref:hypothetical protein n=1 Tax=Streptomyces sp. ISL-11 TaxID=2819174 RepID=UPI002034FB07
MSVTPTSPADRDGSGSAAAAAGRPVRERGDACPGALRLHAADDGALARVRLPGGLLTARQAEVLAGLSERLGDGNLDITSRGNVQIRGLAEGCGGELGGLLRAAGLLPSDRNERIRNVAASPLCGLDGRDEWDGPDEEKGQNTQGEPDESGIRSGGPGGRVDVQAWARELDALLCADGVRVREAAPGPTREPAGTEVPSLAGDFIDLSGLSGRFLFGLDDGRGDIVALAPDVTLIASGPDRAVLCFGTTGPGLRIAAADAPRAAALAAAEFLTAVGESGGRAWRVRELPPGARPRTARLADRLAAAGIACTPLPRPALPLGPPVEPGTVTGPDGSRALSVAAPLGRLTAAQCRLLARTADRDGDGELRVTPWRGVVVP